MTDQWVDADGTVRLTGTFVSGGSQPFKDLGTVVAADLVSGGPQTLYTPSAGEFVCLIYAAGLTLNHGTISFGPYSDVLDAPGTYFITDGSGSQTSQDSLFNAGKDVIPGTASYFPSGPVVARWGTGYSNTAQPGQVLLSAAGTWQANHAYTVGQGVIDGGGHVQIVKVAGTSGGTIPVFTDEGFGTETTDGGVTWFDNDVPPTVGSVHVVALAGVPVAP